MPLGHIVILLADLFVLAIAFVVIREILTLGSVPPFIRTRQQVADEVAEVFGPLPAGSIVYDPGCGDGRVLRALARRNPEALFIGIELRWYPYLLARFKTRREGLTNLTFKRGDMFSENFTDATHVYTYLYSEVMDRLLPKLEREVRPGTRLISLDFPFDEKSAEQEVPLQSKRAGRLGTTLYVYRL